MTGPIDIIIPRIAINHIKLTKLKMPLILDITPALLKSLKYSGNLCNISLLILPSPIISLAFLIILLIFSSFSFGGIFEEDSICFKSYSN